MKRLNIYEEANLCRIVCPAGAIDLAKRIPKKDAR